MEIENETFCTAGDPDRLAKRLSGRRRILLWGGMGTGKSSLALALLPRLGQPAGQCQLLELDPGSAPFGVPGMLCRARCTADGFSWSDCQALCTLNSIRFRLPLLLAARRLLDVAEKPEASGPLLIDPPGVVRGVGGAELLIALAEYFAIDAVVEIRQQGCEREQAAELASLKADLVPVAASPAARLPARLERKKNRTRLWDQWLGSGHEISFEPDALRILGTPPPADIPAAWAGRQAALLSSAGETLLMGEILQFEKGVMTARMTTCRAGKPTILLVRDSGRDGTGRLVTITPVGKMATAGIPTEMLPPVMLPESGSAPVSSHLGPAWATLVGGVFGDPLLHVRLRHRKTSLLFDLGDPARLAAKIAHQVKYVFLSHAHLDHVGGFLWFLRSRMGLFPPCKIFGPAATITRLESFLSAITWDRIEENGPVFEVAEIDSDILQRARLQPGKESRPLPELPIKDGIIVAEKDYTVRFAVLDHHTPSIAYSLEFRREINVRKERLEAAGLPPGPWLNELKLCAAADTPERGIELPDGSRKQAAELIRDLLIIRPGKKLVYATDLADTPENLRRVAELARSAHTLFCETAFATADRDKAEATQHLTVSAAIGIARKAGVKQLVPFHFSKRYQQAPDAIYGELLAAAGPVRIVGHH